MLLLILSLFFFLFFPNVTIATEKNAPSVSVVNPIRGPQLGLEGRDLLGSLKGQYSAVREEEVTATWLWQYSALEDKALIDFAKSEFENQEHGIFLEIDRNFAEKSNIRYRGEGPWYFSDGLFLTSYEQFEREKLITNVFETFKRKFGYYPKTVGAWWVGAESINYMHQKYGITAVIQCADQFKTDRYSIWGTPWSIPYKPSKINSAIPAQPASRGNPEVVILQWATRDPLMAYGNSVEHSTYSIQDFMMKDYEPEEYLGYLRSVFLKKPLDQIVIGLESGFGGESYKGLYQESLHVIRGWEEEGEVDIQTAEEYAGDFIKAGQVYPPTNYFLNQGFQTNDQAFWYHSPRYRVGIQKRGKKIFLSDLRNYSKTQLEDFYILPNTQELIRINTHAVIDSVRFPNQSVLLSGSNEALSVKEGEGGVNLFAGEKLIASFSPTDAILYSLPEDEMGKLPQEFERKGDVASIDFAGGSPDIYLFVVLLMVISYTFYYVRSYREDKNIFSIGIFCLVLSFVILYPVYSSGKFISESIGFTRIGFPLFPAVSLIPLNPLQKIFFVFQLIPILLILIMHFVLTKLVKRGSMLLAIYTGLTFIYFFYVNELFPIMHQMMSGGRRARLSVLLLFIIGFVAFWLLAKLYRGKKEKILTLLLIVSMLSIIFATRDKIFGHKHYIILPFEEKALEEVYSQGKDVIYILPDGASSDYQAITPILITDKYFGQALTSVSWERVDSGRKLSDVEISESIIVLPRYLGAEIYDEDDYEKIFDNAQIGIYKKK
jgi:hypothetical protein